jgi:hypothetical protein
MHRSQGCASRFASAKTIVPGKSSRLLDDRPVVKTPIKRHCVDALLTGPFQMMRVETDGGIAATFWDGTRGYERSKKFDQEPKCSRNDACKQRKQRSKRYEIKQNRHRLAGDSIR